MDDPNTTPDPNTQPGGQSYEHMRISQTQTANKLNSAQEQIDSMQTQLDAANAQIASLSTPSTPPPTAPPSTNGADSGGDPNQTMFDWDQGMMRMEDGSVNPLLVSTLKKAGMSEQHVTNLLGFTEDGSLYRNHLNETLISETAGSKENFDAYLNWGKENMSTQEYSSITASLNDRNTNKFAMQSLMETAQSRGFTVDGAPTKSSNEPTPLPPSTGVSGASTTPLYPGSQELVEATAEAFKSGKQADIDLLNRRVAAGLKR